MGFRKESQVRKSWFFARIRNGHFADAGGRWAWTLTVATGRVGAAWQRFNQRTPGRPSSGSTGGLLTGQPERNLNTGPGAVGSETPN